MRYPLTFAAFLAVLSSGACAAGPAPESAGPTEATAAQPAQPAQASTVLDAALWMQTSGEYEALTRQTWGAASRRLAEAVSDSSWTALLEQGEGYEALPTAAIVDVDETVLDNSPYAARLIEDHQRYSDASWGQWVNEAKARAIPGALDFARTAADLGVTVFYVTNRAASLENGTRRNLEAMGFPFTGEIDVLLLKDERPDWGSDKTTRRAFVAQDYRVVVVAGDDLNDFMSGVRGVSRDERARLVERNADLWGTGWFVFPNPTYGSWESTLLDGLERPSPEDVTRRKLESLDAARG
ncbi:MAG: 5'-nucleotidase, lipoprotein e(P4) family [Gemmatimonadota bacterium]